MQPLVDDMVQDDPAKRPTMDEVERRFEKIVSFVSTRTLGSRVANKDEFIAATVPRDLSHISSQVASALMQKVSFLRRNSGKAPA